MFWWAWIRDEYWGRYYYCRQNPSIETIEAFECYTLVCDSATTEQSAVDQALTYKA
jgi:hypothetical protein